MSKYVSFFSYTGEAWNRMVDTPENRAEAARVLIEQIGGTMESFYWMLGEWDGFVIFDAPDLVSAAAFSARVTSSGMLKNVKTQPLIDAETGRESLEKARSAASAYAPPGALGEWHAEYDAMG